MKSVVRTLLLGAVAIAAFAGAAEAADMDAPLYESVPEIVPVEIGSGWYLRGDVSYGFETDVDVDYRTYVFNPGPPPVGIYGNESYDQFDLNDGVGFGVGAGYQFTDYFRGDLTANYWKHEIGGTDALLSPCSTAFLANTGCRFDDSAEVTAWELMANAYVDLGNFAGITPYIGAGAGAVHLDYDTLKSKAYCTSGGTDCGIAFGGPVDHEGLDSWRFAYAFMAGASYDLTQSLKLDVGYRYLNVDEGDTFGFDRTALGNGASGVQGVDGGFDRHTIQAGLRYSLF